MMPRQYHLDIIIPTENRPASLHRLITSLLRMPLPNSRIVILDDCSTVCEKVPGLGKVSTKTVCQSFNSDDLAYYGAPVQQGTDALLRLYHQYFCAAKYTLLLAVQDELKAGAIQNALSILDSDDSLSTIAVPTVSSGLCYMTKTNRVESRVKAIKHHIKQRLLHLSGRTALDHASTLAATQGLAAADLYLRKAHRFYKTAAVRFGLFLYDYMRQLETQDVLEQVAPSQLIVHFCCWGKSYTEKAKHYLLPSLNTQNNLQAMACSKKVTLLIHCDRAAKRQLEGAHVIQEMKQYLTVIFLVVPSRLLKACQASCRYPNVSYFKRLNRANTNNKYLLLGGLQNHALKVAMQHQALISFMMPDFLLSDGFFKQALTHIENKVMVVTTTFRTDFEKVKGKLASFRDQHTPSTLSIPAAELVVLQLEHMHPAAKRRVVSESTENFTPTPQLIFEAPNGLIIRSLQYHPILIDCGKVDQALKVDYRPIDYLLLNRMVTNAMPYEKQVWVCDDASMMAMMELSDKNVESHFRVKQPYFCDELIELIRRMITASPEVYGTPLNRYFSSIKHRITSDHIGKQEISIHDDPFFMQLTDLTGHIGDMT